MGLEEIIYQTDIPDEKMAGIRQLNSDQKYAVTEEWKADCFLISYLHAELEAAGLLDQAVLVTLADRIAERMPYLTQMITQTGSEYNRYLQRVSPYLIYVGDDTCFGALRAFSYGIGRALEDAGYQVIYAKKNERDAHFYESLCGQSFAGIIATQDTAFCHRTTDGRYLHDLINAPLYWMDYDHPAWFMDLINDMPARTVFLTVDENYAAYIRKIYHRTAVFFPPAADAAAEMPESLASFKDWKQDGIRYQISFVGTLQDDLDSDMQQIRNVMPDFYSTAATLVQQMKENTDEPQEAVLEQVCPPMDADEFSWLMHGWAFLGKDLAHRYRKKVIHSLLEAGLDVDVFHESWKIFDSYPNLHIHPSVSYEKTDEIYRQSSISLNTMTWHKAGFTERIANAQMHGALSATDGTTYIRKCYTDGQDILIYDLTDKGIEELPKRIEVLLGDKDRLMEMAYNGMKKAQSQHTWKNRARTLIQMQLAERQTNEY